MGKIGIIGGMSYESSMHYYERINKQVNEQAGGLTSAEIIMYSVDFGKIRPLMLAGKWNEIGDELARIAQTLENDGADYIAIATNTMHKLADYVQSKIHVPLIHIADCVAEKCQEKDISKVGLLGTGYTMTENFLKDRLTKNGLTVYTPSRKEEISEIDRIIFDELCKGVINEDSKAYYINVIDQMIQEQGIKGVILGCTEIEMLIKPEDLTIPVFDTTQAHIDTLAELSLEKEYQKRIKFPNQQIVR